MYKALLLFAGMLVACFLPAAAQRLQLSVEAGAQHSFIPGHTLSEPIVVCPPGSGFCGENNTAELEFSYREKPAGYLRGLIRYTLKNRFQLYHHLNLHLVRYQSKVRINSISGPGTEEPAPGGWQPGTPMGEVECQERDENGNVLYDRWGQPVRCNNNAGLAATDDRIGKTSLLYLSQEIGLRYQPISRLWVHGGVDLSYRIHSQQWVSELTYTNPQTGSPTPSITAKKDRSGSGFNSILLGLQAGLAYDVSEKYALSLGYHHSLSPIYNAEAPSAKANEKSRLHLLRLGVQYRLKGW